MLKTILTIAIAVLLVLYPVLMYAGLRYLSPRWLAAALLVLFSLRLYTLRQHISATRAREFVPIFIGVAITSAVVLFQNDDLFLRFNPVIINVNFLMVFGYTLWKPPSMIERFARLAEPDLPPSGVAYTRRVTQIWCVFFFANASIALWTAFQSLQLWTLYNGLISYVAMGIFLGVEWVVRQFHKRAHRAADAAQSPATEASAP